VQRGFYQTMHGDPLHLIERLVFRVTLLTVLIASLLRPRG
jgi:hypothetical protein